MITLLHWCALRMSDLGELLFELGGNLECWCDERAFQAKWGVDDFALPTLRPEDLAMPALDGEEHTNG